jgi:hypothetical protein
MQPYWSQVETQEAARAGVQVRISCCRKINIASLHLMGSILSYFLKAVKSYFKKNECCAAPIQKKHGQNGQLQII